MNTIHVCVWLGLTLFSIVPCSGRIPLVRSRDLSHILRRVNRPQLLFAAERRPILQDPPYDPERRDSECRVNTAAGPAT
jgi:hypothetical protein